MALQQYRIEFRITGFTKTEHLSYARAERAVTEALAGLGYKVFIIDVSLTKFDEDEFVEVKDGD